MEKLCIKMCGITDFCVLHDIMCFTYLENEISVLHLIYDHTPKSHSILYRSGDTSETSKMFFFNFLGVNMVPNEYF